MTDYKFTISGKDKTGRMWKSIKTGLRGVRSAVNSTQLQVGALAGAAGLGVLINQSLKYADDLGKMSDRLNVATEDLAAFHHLTELNGESAESFDRAVEKMVRGIGEAERGFGTATKALKELNIDVRKIAGKGAKEQFLIIADGLKGVKTQTEKASLAADIFGRKGVRLLTTLNQGREGFESARKEVDEFGLSMSRVDAAKAEAANDEILRSQQAIKGVGVKISTQLAPFITAATKKFTRMALTGTEGSEWIAKSIDGVGTAIGVMADGIHGVEIIFQGVKIAGLGFGTAVVGSLKLIMDGIAFLGNSLKDLYLSGLRPIIELGNELGVVGDNILQGFNNLDDNLKFETPVVISEAYTNMVNELSEQNSELGAMLEAPLPSTGIKLALNEIKVEAELAGKAIEEKVAAQMAALKGVEAGSELTADEQKEVDKLARKLERIRQSNLTELELLREKESEELAIIQESLTQKQISHADWLEQKYKTEQRFEKRRVELKKKADKTEGDSLAQLNNLKGVLGKKGAKIAQAASLKETIYNTEAAAMGAYKALASIPFIGPALGAAAYATVMATGLKSQLGIRSGSGGGGGVSTPPVSSSNNNSLSTSPDLNQFKQQENTEDKRVVIQVFGDLNSNHAETLIDDINQILEDTDKQLVPPTSRNALEIREAA